MPQANELPTGEQVRRFVERAVESFLRNELGLLEDDVHEQTITSALAYHLRQQFGSKWDIDCEYNREEGKTKRLGGRPVKPDIIVHRRNSTTNILVIEGKKSKTLKSDDLDELRKFKDAKGYPFAALICFQTGRGLRSYLPTIEWV